MCLQGKCSWRSPKSLRKVPQCVYKENLVGERPQAPSNDKKSLRKVPPMATLRRPPWVKWRPPSPCPHPPSRFSKYAAALFGLKMLTQCHTFFTRKSSCVSLPAESFVLSNIKYIIIFYNMYIYNVIIYHIIAGNLRHIGPRMSLCGPYNMIRAIDISGNN